MTKYDESQGVWRTVGGRRIFIRNDQTLADAMKESGKFKREVAQRELFELEKQHKHKGHPEYEKKLKELKEKYMQIPEKERVQAYADGKNWKDLVKEKDSKYSDLENSKALEDRVKQVREENKRYRNSLNETDYSQEKLDQVYQTEDYTEIVNHLSNSELQKMNQAAHDMNTSEPGTPAYKNAKDYLTKMENKAAGKYLDSEAKKRDAFNKKQDSKSTITDDIRAKVAESSKGAMMETYTKDIRDASGLKVKEAFETDLYGNGKEDRFILEDGRIIKHTTESFGQKEDTWRIEQKPTFNQETKQLEYNTKTFDSYDDMIKSLGNSNNKYVEYYKKEHLGEPSNYKKGDEIEFNNGYYQFVKGKVVREATDEEKRHQMNTNLKGYVVRDSMGNEHVIADTKIKKQGGHSQAYKLAYKEYKKKHPNTRLSFGQFVDMSEGK